MLYVINVMKNGNYLFSTADEGIFCLEKLNEVYKVFEEKFTKEEGYKIIVMEHFVNGKIEILNMDDMEN